jgi:hypothetical protein
VEAEARVRLIERSPRVRGGVEKEGMEEGTGTWEDGK